MAERADDLQQTIEEKRQDIEETRASMTEKLELLEERVRETLEDTKSAVEGIVENVKGTVDETVGAVKETVDGAKSTVENIVENVKGTMDETVNNVKQAFDLSYQVHQHPWLMVGGAVLLGTLLEKLTRPESSTNGRPYAAEIDEDQSLYATALAGGPEAYSAIQKEDEREDTKYHGSHQKPQHRSWGANLGQFQEEFDMIKGAIIGTVMGTVREMVRQSMPSVAPTLEKALTSASRKMGADPIDPSSSQPYKKTEREKWEQPTPQGMTDFPAASSSFSSREEEGRSQQYRGR